MQETFNGIKDIKLKSLEKFFHNIYQDSIERFTTAAYKQNTLLELPKIIIELVFLIIVCLIVLIQSLNNSNFDAIIPVLGLYAAVAFKVNTKYFKIFIFFSKYSKLKPSIDLINLEMKNEKKLKNENTKKHSKNIDFLNNISIKNMLFNYEGKKKLFENFNLIIKKIHFLELLEKSGSGKSTLIDLITGILKPVSGEILVDKKNIDLDISSWRNKIGYVSQNIFLIDNSIKKNIALGVSEDEINDEKVIKSCKEAMIYDFVISLEQKFDTKIGEKGIKLSEVKFKD